MHLTDQSHRTTISQHDQNYIHSASITGIFICWTLEVKMKNHGREKQLGSTAFSAWKPAKIHTAFQKPCLH